MIAATTLPHCAASIPTTMREEGRGCSMVAIRRAHCTVVGRKVHTPGACATHTRVAPGLRAARSTSAAGDTVIVRLRVARSSQLYVGAPYRPQLISEEEAPGDSPRHQPQEQRRVRLPPCHRPLWLVSWGPEPSGGGAHVLLPLSVHLLAPVAPAVAGAVAAAAPAPGSQGAACMGGKCDDSRRQCLRQR